MIRILFQGDSITDGNRYKEVAQRWDLNHQIGHSYVFSIVSYLGRKYPGKYQFINRGITSESVDEAKLRWERDTLDEHPDILSILFGINGNRQMDGNYPEGVEEHLEHFDKTYRELLDMARAQNPELKIVLIEPFYIAVGKYIPGYETFKPIFRRKQEIIKKIAEDYGAIFVPVQERLEQIVKDSAETLLANGCPTDPTAYWLWDGIHPTEPMHGFLAEFWLEATKDIL